MQTEWWCLSSKCFLAWPFPYLPQPRMPHWTQIHVFFLLLHSVEKERKEERHVYKLLDVEVKNGKKKQRQQRPSSRFSHRESTSREETEVIDRRQYPFVVVFPRRKQIQTCFQRQWKACLCQISGKLSQKFHCTRNNTKKSFNVWLSNGLYGKTVIEFFHWSAE